MTNQPVNTETAAQYKRQGNVDVLEHTDIDHHITPCEQCNEQFPPNTIHCYCGEKLPNLQTPKHEQKIPEDDPKVVCELLYHGAQIHYLTFFLTEECVK